jgi:hypothetical protein
MSRTLLKALFCSYLLIFNLLAAQETAMATSHDNIPQTPSGKDYDLVIHIDKLLDSLKNFKRQSEAMLENRIANLENKDLAAQELLDHYNKSFKRYFIARSIEAFQKYAKSTNAEDWDEITQSNIDAIEAVFNFIYWQSLGLGSRSRSILLLVDPKNPKHDEIIQEVKQFNEERGIKSFGQLRMGDFLLHKLESTMDVSYKNNSVTNKLSALGTPLD